jgi:hypothetical protein
MPVETESYAYLRVTGSGTVDLISKQMGLKPDDGWSEGDLSPRRRGTYTFANWKLQSGEKKGLSIDTHLRSLWKRIEPYGERLISLGPEFSRYLVCTAWFPTRDTQFIIAAGHFSTAAYYRLELDFDFYFMDESGDENFRRGHAS